MKKILLFGAGMQARRTALEYLQNHESIDAVVVSDKSCNPDTFFGVPVISIEEALAYRESSTVIVGVTDAYHDEVTKLLKDNGFTDVRIPINTTIDYEILSDDVKKKYLSEWYIAVTGEKLDWGNLRSYNEKMQWLKLFDRVKEKSRYADKYLVRDYVKDVIGDRYLIPLLGVWDKYDDIDFNELPDEFVLKCNHGSSWNEIIHDKSKADKVLLKEKFDAWMSTNFVDLFGMELHYGYITPKIIAEKLLRIEGESDIPDYKFFVFDGEVKLIQVDIDRSQNHRRNLYTPEWEYVPASICYPTAPEVNIPKPGCLMEMIEISEKLAEGFIHVRVDLYLVEDRIYFGEMTFTHGSGQEKFSPKEFGYKMGEWISLPQNNS